MSDKSGTIYGNGKYRRPNGAWGSEKDPALAELEEVWDLVVRGAPILSIGGPLEDLERSIKKSQAAHESPREI